MFWGWSPGMCRAEAGGKHTEGEGRERERQTDGQRETDGQPEERE